MPVNFNRNIGMVLLALWLILSGFAGMAAMPLPSPIMQILAIVAGVLILMGR